MDPRMDPVCLVSGGMGETCHLGGHWLSSVTRDLFPGPDVLARGLGGGGGGGGGWVEQEVGSSKRLEAGLRPGVWVGEEITGADRMGAGGWRRVRMRAARCGRKRAAVDNRGKW